MAKSSKLEDYWKQHNIEGLFKELTHALVQRMPSDPAVALVQHLQKKFPRSFKSTADDDHKMSIMAKTTASSLQLQSTSSLQPDSSFLNTSDMDLQRRDSNQSQANTSIVFPSTGSAFTDLLKRNTASTQQVPQFNLTNIMMANRLGQQVVKLGKNLRSDRDILDEELIKPTKTNTNVSSTANPSTQSVGANIQQAQTHEQPSVLQLIKYKQTIRTENDRRLHREELARIAKQEHDKLRSLQPNVVPPAEDVSTQYQQQKSSEDHTLSQANKDKVGAKPTRKAIVKSKEEEELLNDENLFQGTRQRNRERNRSKLLTSDANTLYNYRQTATNLGATMRTTDGSSMPMMHFGICKKCGNMINDEHNQSTSAEPTPRPFDTYPSPHSVESSTGVVDDWFESPSEVSTSREIIPLAPDSITPRPTDKQNFFQPINRDNVQNLLPKGPTIVADDQTTTNRLTTPRLSESNVFTRTPSPTFRRSPILTSPIAKRQQGNALVVPNNQSTKPMGHPASTSTPLSMFPDFSRQMSNRSAFEDALDEN